jgi:hypothetical protein
MGVCGCTTDADCGDAMSGRVCDMDARRCVEGCYRAEGRNGCPMGRSCTSDDPNTRGTCSTTCNRDADCMAPTPYCRRGAEGDAGIGNLCVSCLNDMHCAERMDGRRVCDPIASVCVQCTDGNRMTCVATGNGTACIMGVCGCTNDNDCSPNRRCDRDTNRCVERPMADAGVDASRPTDLGMDAALPRVVYRGGGCACGVASPGAPSRAVLTLLVFSGVAVLGRRARRRAA